MQISDDKVVFIHYTLTNDAGEVLDASGDEGPFAYIHGAGNIIVGLEKALSGKVPGDSFKVRIPPEEAYGLRDETLVTAVPRSAFAGIDDIQPGMRFQANSPSGAAHVVTIARVEGDQIVVDGNHPLAGEPLHFVVEVAEVRDATTEELDHGHLHGAGGHHHG